MDKKINLNNHNNNSYKKNKDYLSGKSLSNFIKCKVWKKINLHLRIQDEIKLINQILLLKITTIKIITHHNNINKITTKIKIITILIISQIIIKLIILIHKKNNMMNFFQGIFLKMIKKTLIKKM